MIGTLARAAYVALLTALCVGGPSYAAPVGPSAALSATSATADTVATTLTVRSGDTVLAVDPASLQVQVGGVTVTPTILPPSGRATMLLIDTSGSLSDADLSAVQRAALEFLALVPADVKVGIVSFSTAAGVELAPTLDRAAAKSVIQGLQMRGNTALYQAVTLGVGALKGVEERSIILFTDGKDTSSGDYGITKPMALAALKANNVRAEVIALQTPMLDQPTLAQFAAVGGGSVVTTTDRQAVTTSFTNAARTFSSQVRLSAKAPAGLAPGSVLTVRGKASGQAFVATGALPAAASAPSPAPTPSAKSTPSASAAPAPVVSGPVLSRWLLPAALLFVALPLGLVTLFVSGAFESERKKRVAAITDYTLQQAAATRRSVRPAGISDQLVGLGDRVMANRESTSRTLALIEQADLPWRAGEWLVLRLVAVVVGVALGIVLFPANAIIGALLGLIAGVLLPAAGLRFLARRRRRKFDEVLPDVLSLVATGLSSGFSLLQALDSVARDAPQPAAKEFSRALAETRIGADIDVALDHLADRMDSDAMRWASMTIKIQRDVGGNLAESLRTTTQTIRERESLKRHVRALSAEGRLSAYILIAMPIGIFFYASAVNYEYERLLWTTFPGLLMVFFGLVAMVIGVFWMRKIVQIEV